MERENIKYYGGRYYPRKSLERVKWSPRRQNYL